jgi:DNA-3-methyladenine glycosylase
MNLSDRLTKDFFCRDVLEVAPALIGKKLVRLYNDGRTESYIISETEAYRGVEDLACHASKGRTPRTEIMYQDGGHIYVYLIYGMYWMLNFVAGPSDIPQAALIRGLQGIDGPGKLTRKLQIDKSFYGEDLSTSSRIYVTEGLQNVSRQTSKRIGIGYAGEIWENKPWRFTLTD